MPDRLWSDGVSRRRGNVAAVKALIFTAAYSRHVFVWPSHSQSPDAVISRCDAARAFLGAMFEVFIPQNLKPVVTVPDPTFIYHSGVYTRA